MCYILFSDSRLSPLLERIESYLGNVFFKRRRRKCSSIQLMQLTPQRRYSSTQVFAFVLQDFSLMMLK